MDRLFVWFFFGLILSLVLLTASCSPDDEPGLAGGGTVDDKPTLVTNLNGYQYEGTFKETKDVVQYGTPQIKHIESYHDSIRVMFTTLDAVLIRYRWTVQNRYKGKVTREFEIGDGFAPDGNNYKFAFNNPTFQLYGFVDSNIVTFSKGSKSSYYVSRPNNNFTYRFNENYIVFFGSASNIYVHENKLQKYTAPAPNIGYVLTSEPSVSWADYIFNDDAASGILFRDEIYTGFFNATLDSNYIGIAKGQQTLDTLFINNNAPTIYYSTSAPIVYLSRDEQKIYLTLFKIKGPSSFYDISLFEMDINEKIIRPIFQNKDLPVGVMTAFVRGKLYFGTKVMNHSAVLEDLPLPTLVANASVGRFIYGETKMFLIVQKEADMLEVYSKAY